MDDEYQAFTLTAVGPRFPALRPDADGRWRHVLDQDGPVGVFWLMLDDPSGIGVVWVRQTEAVEKLRRHVVAAKQAGTAVLGAYYAAELLEGVELGPESSGKLSGANDEMAELAEES